MQPALHVPKESQLCNKLCSKLLSLGFMWKDQPGKSLKGLAGQEEITEQSDSRCAISSYLATVRRAREEAARTAEAQKRDANCPPSRKSCQLCSKLQSEMRSLVACIHSATSPAVHRPSSATSCGAHWKAKGNCVGERTQPERIWRELMSMELSALRRKESMDRLVLEDSHHTHPTFAPVRVSPHKLRQRW